MTFRKLTESQNEVVNKLLNDVRSELERIAAGDRELLFSYRRRIYLRLTHDERGTPAHRKRLKALKMAEQRGKCAICGRSLPPSEAELDRHKAIDGYTRENTQLVHHDCHRQQQRDRGFRTLPKST